MIAFSCPGCLKRLSVDENLAGKKVKCPACDQVVPVLAQAAAGHAGTTEPPSPASAVDPLTDPPLSQPDATVGVPPPAVQDSSVTEFLAPPQAADELGRLGKYRILKILGRGGMGVVFQAEDPKLKRSVAIKAILPSLADSESAGQRFLREAQAMAAVDHDHIVRIYQVDEDRGVPYMAMELLKGEPLDERLRRDGKLPVLDVLRIGREIAEGLSAAHTSGLIHRDIKPGNIWLETPKSRVKILDFGLARPSDAADGGLTHEGTILGTPAYMAPEQARGETVDARCDLFSLGVVLYRLCTGRQPFVGDDPLTTIMAVTRHEPAPPIAIDPALPPELSDLIMKLLAKDPAQRVPSAAVVVEVLCTLEKTLVSAQDARDHTVAVSAAPPKRAAAPARRSISARSSKKPPRRRLVAVLGGAAALALVVAGIILFWQTPTGTVRIEINDPQIQVAFDKDGPTFTGVEAREIKAIPGAHGLHIKRGDLEFDTKKFTVTRGETIRLKVEWFKDGKLQVVQGNKVIGHAKALPKRAHLTPLPAPAPTERPTINDGFVSLFNGKDLSGWTTFPKGPGNWKVVDGNLTCAGPRSYLFTERDDFTDFHFRVEARVQVKGNSGQYFRCQLGPEMPKGYFAQIQNSDTKYPDKTGSLCRVPPPAPGASLVRITDELAPDNTWFTQEVIAKGNRIQILVNGKKVVDYVVKENMYLRGRLALEHFTPVTKVEFRKVEVKELLPDGPSQPPARGPYDAIDPAKLALDPALPWRPKELIAVVGQQCFDSWRRYVTKVQLSKDGKTLYASSQDGTITIRDADSGRVRQVFEHRVWSPYRSAPFAVSPDERWLVFQKDKDYFLVWDLKQNKGVKTLPGAMHDLQFSPDGKWLLALSPPKLRIIELGGDWKVKQEIDVATRDEYRTGIALVAVSRDSRLAAAIFDSAGGSRVRSFDIGSGDRIGDFQFERRVVSGTIGLKNDELFLIWDNDGRVIGRFDLKTGKAIPGKPLSSAAGIALSPDGKQLLVGRFTGLTAVNADDLSQIWHKSTSLSETIAVAFSGDGERIAAASSGGSLEVRNAKNGELIGKLPRRSRDYSRLFLLPDGRAFTAGPGIDSRLVDFVTGRDRDLPRMDSVIPTPDGRQLIVALPKERRVAIVDLETNKPVRDLKFGLEVLAAVPFDAGRRLLLQTKDSLAVADFQSGVVEKEFPTPGGTVRGLAVDAAGRRAALVHSTNGHLDVYELQSAKLERTIELTGTVWWAWARLIFSRDGQWLACGHSNSSYANGPESGKVRLWAAATGEERKLVVPKKDCWPGFAVDISPGGEELANGGLDGCVHFWDIKTGSYRRSIRVGPVNGVINNVAYAPDGRHLLVDTPCGMVLLLRLAEAPLAAANPGPWQPLLDEKLSHWWKAHNDKGPDAFGVIALDGEPVVGLSMRPTRPLLTSKKHYKNAHVRLEFQLPNKGTEFYAGYGFADGKASMAFYVANDGKTRRVVYGTQWRETVLDKGQFTPTGAAKGGGDFALVTASLEPPGTWNRLDLVRVEDRFACFINGRFIGAVAETRGNYDGKEAPFGVGSINIAPSRGDALVRRIEVRDIDAFRPELIAANPFPPLDPAFAKAVAAMKAEQQIKAVMAELVKRNPGFNGKVESQIIDKGVVTSLSFLTDNVTDIAPLRALTGLRKLTVNGSAFPQYYTERNGKLADLSPLKGMNLTELKIRGTQVSDLAPLAGMGLTSINCNFTKVSDLAPLKDMKLTFLACSGTKVSELTPLKGMPLTYLEISATPVSDLTPLEGMLLKTLNLNLSSVSDLAPLKGMRLAKLYLNDAVARKNVEVLRSMTMLQEINGLEAKTYLHNLAAVPPPPLDPPGSKRSPP